MHNKKFMYLTAIAILAAVIYNSWPLGYWLNPMVARRSLASGFEALHQPYNWLFISADIISSLLILFVCFLLRSIKAGRAVQLSLLFTSFFAIGTIVDALLPEHCVPNLMRCASFTEDHTLLLHGIFSIGASVFLFLALFVLWAKRPKDTLLNLLIIAYAIFGFISLVQAIAPGDDGNWSQDYYMILCGVFIAALPYIIYKTKPSRR